MLEKVNLHHLLVIGTIILAVVILFSLFGKPSKVHNNAAGTVRVGEGLEQARGNQQFIEDRINSAAERIDGITGRIGNAQNRAGTIESLVSEAERIARTDRAILQEVKKRAEAGAGSEGK